jgi:hypothetical protein
MREKEKIDGDKIEMQVGKRNTPTAENSFLRSIVLHKISLLLWTDLLHYLNT